MNKQHTHSMEVFLGLYTTKAAHEIYMKNMIGCDVSYHIEPMNIYHFENSVTSRPLVKSA